MCVDTGSPSFTYPPLDEERREIRILELLPGQADEPIHGQLHIASLPARLATIVKRNLATLDDHISQDKLGMTCAIDLGLVVDHTLALTEIAQALKPYDLSDGWVPSTSLVTPFVLVASAAPAANSSCYTRQPSIPYCK